MIVLLALAAWFVYQWTRPTLADDAESAARSALVRRDPEPLYDYILRVSERATQPLARAICVHVALPGRTKVEKFRLVAIGEPNVNRGESQGKIEWQIQGPDGNLLSWTTVVWNTDGGGRLDAFDSLLLAWWLEYAISQGKSQSDTVAFREAILKGLRNDRAALKSFGITLRPSQYSWLPPLSLDRWESELRQRVEATSGRL